MLQLIYQHLALIFLPGEIEKRRHKQQDVLSRSMHHKL
jgi:hypothetical protein